jgi:hypothetical protein
VIGKGGAVNKTVMVVSLGALLAGMGAAALVSAAPWARTAVPQGIAAPAVALVAGPAFTPAPSAAPTGLDATSTDVVVRAGDVSTTDPGVLPRGLATYKLSDGRFVVVDRAAGLPAVVVADLPAQASAAVARATEASARALALETLRSQLLAGTGRSLVVVYASTGMTDPDASGPTGLWFMWGRDDAGSYSAAADTQEQATAKAQAWIDAHPDPSAFELVVTPAP